MPVRRTTHKSTRRPARRNPSRGGAADQHAAVELVLFAENDGDLYRQMRKPIETNLLKKYKAGTYSHTLALKAWMNFADTAAKKYSKEYGSPGDWSRVFTPATRRLAATEMRDTWEREMPYEAGKR